MNRSRSSLLAGIFAFLGSASNALWGADSPKPALADVHYGPHERQVLNVWKAETKGPAPVMFFIHGGGWMVGDKEKPDFLDLCLKSGISVVSINYRFIPDATAAKVSPPVEWPLHDAARALQFTRSKAKEWNLDSKRVAVVGGSAGGFSSLWLALHADLADPGSADPVARESTRVTCALTFVPQTTLDPKLMREWIPNNDYGPHAFALPNFEEFLKQREKLLPYIEANSPLSLVTPDDPPIYLFYDSVPALGQPHKDPPHSANWGVKLAEKLKAAGVECEFNTPGAQGIKHPNIFGFIEEKLKAVPGK